MIQGLIRNLAAELERKKDQAIKEALTNAGFEFDLDFIKENVSLVTREGDKFEHYYYRFGKIDEKRIISFERMPKTELVTEGRTVSQNASFIYY